MTPRSEVRELAEKISLIFGYDLNKIEFMQGQRRIELESILREAFNEAILQSTVGLDRTIDLRIAAERKRVIEECATVIDRVGINDELAMQCVRRCGQLIRALADRGGE